MTKFFEPTKERAARRPGERSAEKRFFYAGRLTDDHYFAEDSSAGNRWRQHARTAPALQQARDMSIQEKLLARRRHQRRKNDKIRLSTMLMMRQVTIGK